MTDDHPGGTPTDDDYRINVLEANRDSFERMRVSEQLSEDLRYKDGRQPLEDDDD